MEPTVVLKTMSIIQQKLHIVSLFLHLIQIVMKKASYDPLCVHCRSGQSHISAEGADHPHKGAEAEAPVPGGAVGALPPGAQKALHQGGSQYLLRYSMVTHGHNFFFLCNQHVCIRRSWRVNCPQTILWCLMRSHPESEGGLGLPSSWMKGWFICIKRYRQPSINLLSDEVKDNSLYHSQLNVEPFFKGFRVAGTGNGLGYSASDLWGSPQTVPGGAPQQTTEEKPAAAV